MGQSELGDPSKRILDPACGSGTFLVILIKHVRERLKNGNLTPTKALNAVLRNIIGFDLNPLAVIAARTNYLLALGDLLKARKGDIHIPVYQADAVLTPSRGSDLLTGDVYPLKTSVGEFRVPIPFAERERMDVLANVLDESVEAGVSKQTFLRRLKAATKLPTKKMREAESELTCLFQQLKELHDQGLNGVWARIIKNAFAPLFVEPCNYVVGNPPWVNWESLPDEYRGQTKPLWEHYGLFPHGGMDTILGKGKKDICMLLTYVAVDRYLVSQGKLGFVITESVFKTAGAGQGFRRFRLPDGTPFGPLAVEDMVSLAPFEKAANRTAILIVMKGRDVRFPISYSRWRKRHSGRGSAIGFDSPYESVTKDKITFSSLQATPIAAGTQHLPGLRGDHAAGEPLRNYGEFPITPQGEGANTGGANAVYWVEVLGKRPGGLVMVSNVVGQAKRKIPTTQAAMEDGLLYPLLRSGDQSRWLARPELRIILAQDPETRRGLPVEVNGREISQNSFLPNEVRTPTR